MKREARLEHHRSIATQGIAVELLGVAQVRRVQLTAAVEHLGVAQRDRGAGGAAGHREPRPAREILPEVEQHGAGGRAPHDPRPQLAHAPHRRRHRGHQC